MAGTASIYRLDNNGENESSVGNNKKVEFDNGATTPDALSFIQRFKGTMSIIGQENPNPDSNNPNYIDETGLAIVQVEIWGIFKDLGATRPLAIADMRDWLKEAKTLKKGSSSTDANLPFGRFGIRNDQSPEYNLNPTDSSGYVLEHFEIEEDYGGKKGGVTFYCKLRFQGDITELSA